MFEEDSRSLCLNEIRVCAGSEKMSFGIGNRPCSKGSRRGWITVVDVGGGGGVDGADSGGGSVMVRIEKACENERM